MAQSDDAVGTLEADVGRVYRKCSTIYDDIASAKDAIASLSAKLLIVKKEKARRQQQCKAEKKRGSVCIEDIASAIVRMSDGNYNMAETFLVQNSGRISWRKQQSVTDCIEELRLEFHNSQVVRGTDDASHEYGKWVAGCAKAFIAEYSLAQWVQQLNLTLGIAPHSRIVAVEARKLSLMQEAGQSTVKVRKQYLRRWRRRWQIKLGIISCREVLLRKDMQQKVGNVARFVLLTYKNIFLCPTTKPSLRIGYVFQLFIH